MTLNKIKNKYSNSLAVLILYTYKKENLDLSSKIKKAKSIKSQHHQTKEYKSRLIYRKIF